MKVNFLLEEIRKSTAPEIKKYVDMSFRIANNIYSILESKGMEQKDLAKLMKKNESEVSKWLSGTHNFTLKTLANISVALGEDILQCEEKHVVDHCYTIIEVRQKYAEFKKDNVSYKTAINLVCQSKTQRMGRWSSMPMRGALN